MLMPKEFEFINQIKQKYSLDKIGDDCAILPKNETHDMLITSDLIVEDIDFRRSWMIPVFLGHKALAVSLSDIAAMGGKPQYSMLSIGIPEDVWKTEFVDEFYKGYLSLANNFGVELIGGDVSKTPDKIIIDSTVIGEVENGKAIFRSGAKIGDLIFVSAELGGASAGLKLLENKLDNFEDLRLKQLKPIPRVEEGQTLANLITSMIDISDGLSSDLKHICEASKVGAKIYADKIPVNQDLKLFTNDPSEQLNFALNGGEDFELLFTVNPKKHFQKNLDQFFCIGEVTANVGIIELISSQKSAILQPKGYQHF